MSLLRDWIKENMLLKFTSPVYFDFSNVSLWTGSTRSTYFGQYWFRAKYFTALRTGGQGCKGSFFPEFANGESRAREAGRTLLQASEESSPGEGRETCKTRNKTKLKPDVTAVTRLPVNPYPNTRVFV